MNEYNKEFWKALDELVSKSEVIIDRPKGTVHPKFPDFVYKVDYGYLKDTSSMDGAGIDVWLGSCGKQIDAVIVYETHNRTPYMKGILVRRQEK